MRFGIKNINCRAYSLVEVLSASGILLMGIGAVLSLSHGTLSQEEVTRQLARGYCFQENAAKLYYLGLEPEEIIDLLPLDTTELELNFTDSYMVRVNDVEVEASSVSVKIKSPNSFTINNNLSLNSHEKNPGRDLPSIEVYRPTTRLD